MRSDLDRHIERHLKDKEFKIYFGRAEAKRNIAQEIAALLKEGKYLEVIEKYGRREGD